ncbi:uncharacterized protein LY89DRAFT_169714 [Mollisia scopiformis]|uniref:Rhodopsin domain-containing protein n=1 Tax=Mollisia scopiformis TaxID=149040 RepID=A0A194XS88_MOLSC|nr:uncharacterized protein LY89DRAFT_169714 [Mollisia scopiformis]KUJ23165.1 hypothetical protein LY89DRAFT_169714 [Mollisia scopiformis]
MYLQRDVTPPAIGTDGMSPVGPVSTSTANNGPVILAVTGAFTGFAALVVIMRIYVRAFMLKTVGADDWIMMVAMLASAAVYACFVAEVDLGVGHHMSDPTLVSNLEKIFHWFFYHGLLNVFGISTVKVSIGFFLLRLVQGTMYKRILVAWITFLVIFGLASCGTIAFDCTPISAAWDLSLLADPNTRCFSTSVFRSIALVNGAINAFTDLAFALLPLPIIIPLKINLRTKISLICILSLGYFAFAASIVKEVLLSSFFTDPDPFFGYTFQIWNDIELNVGILATCLPALRPLFAWLFETASALKATSLRRTGLGSNANNKIYRLKDGHNMDPMPSRSTTALSQRGYRITVIGGPKVSEDGEPIFDRRPSLASSGPMSKLEQSITEADSEKDYEDQPMHFDRRFRVRSPTDREFDFQSRRLGILRTTEVMVER